MQTLKPRFSYLIFLFVWLSACQPLERAEPTPSKPPVFDGQRAYDLAATQVSFGPRFSGSEGHQNVQDWIVGELEKSGWIVEIQAENFQNKLIQNIIAHRQVAKDSSHEWILLGAHYDSRMIADQDPDLSRQSDPVIGANDGASGVAVLLELARVLPKVPEKDVWLAFFDAEDNGRIPGWDWIMGSTAFVDSMESYPDKVVIVDMVGDVSQEIYIEKSSDPDLVEEIWQTATELGIITFINEPKHRILDDHTPFLNKEIPAVDIIDFDYAYWHTTHDTMDKISAESLKNVGDVLLSWLTGK